MRGIVLASLMIVGVLVLAGTAIGVTYAKYDEATTEIILEDGINCTIEGKQVSNGDRVTSGLKDGYLNIHAESETPMVIGYSGVWYSDDRTEIQNGDSNNEVTSYDFRIPFNHGKYNGKLLIRNMASDAYGYPITMVLHFDESKITVWYGMANSYAHDGQTVHILGDVAFDVHHVDKNNHTFSWNGYWGNDLGDHKDLQGTETTNALELIISGFQCNFGPCSGEITFTVTD